MGAVRAGGTRARQAARGSDEAVRGPTSTSEVDPDRLAELESRRDFLLRSLDDLEREYEAGEVSDDDYRELRSDYTARAAAVIRAMEQNSPRTSVGRRSGSRSRTIVWFAAVLVFGVLAGVLMAQASGSRAPGDTHTGGIVESSRDLLLRAERLTGQAQMALQAGDGAAAVEAYRGAIQAYDEALELDPLNVEAMTYRGWLLHNLALQAGDSPARFELDAEALRWLTEAVQTDPSYPDARVFRAIVYEDLGEIDAALADIQAVDQAAVPEFMRETVGVLRDRLQAAAGNQQPAAQPGG